MTTQALSNSKRKAGLSTSRRKSLLNAVQNGRTGGVSRLNALNTASVTNARLAKSNYDKLQQSSSSLETQVKLLGDKVKDGKEIDDAATNLVKHFNDTLQYLKSASGTLNNYYRQNMKDIAVGSRKNLEEVGITVAGDGTLTLNKEKLAGADAEDIKKALGADSDFMKRVSTVAGRVADNAKASADSAYSQYNSAGGLANSYQSKYDFWS